MSQNSVYSQQSGKAIVPEKPPEKAKAAQGPQWADPPLEAGDVARLNGKAIDAAEYQAFLAKRLGNQYLLEFLDQKRVSELAKQASIEVDEAQVTAMVDYQMQRWKENFYQGSLAKFQDSLKAKGQNISQFRQKLRLEHRHRYLVDRLILKRRVVDEKMMHEKFVQVYGVGGSRAQLRHILVKMDPSGLNPDEIGPEEATALLNRLLADLDKDPQRFIEFVGKHSDDVLTKKNDGFIPSFKTGVYGREFDQAVAKLKGEGEIAGPVKSPYGLHLIQLVRRLKVPYEDVKETIREHLEQQAPTAKEKADFINWMRKTMRVEVNEN